MLNKNFSLSIKNKYLLINIAFIAFLAMYGCASMRWDNYYPYCQINPNYIHRHQPKNFEECLDVIDAVLSKEAKDYFKNSDSSIAVIEICSDSKGIADLFANRWYLQYHETTAFNGNLLDIHYPQKVPVIVDNFEKEGVTDPSIIIRVIFSCYYKRINNLSYDWSTEIRENKKYWMNKDSVFHAHSKENLTIKQIEHKILSDYYFDLLNIYDTVDILFNRHPRITRKTPNWYYLTGIIQHKIASDNLINIKLIDIKADLGIKYMIGERDTIAIGDTLTVEADGWLKRGHYYFNYNRNREYRSKLQL